MVDLIKIVRAINLEVGSPEPLPRYDGTITAEGTPVSGPLASKTYTWQDRQHRTEVKTCDDVDGVEMDMYAKTIKKDSHGRGRDYR